MPKIKRPDTETTGKVLSVRIRMTTSTKLDERAEALGTSRSKIVNEALKYYLARPVPTI